MTLMAFKHGVPERTGQRTSATVSTRKMAGVGIASSSRAVEIPGEIPGTRSRSAYGHFIREAAEKYGIDEALIHSVIQVESAFNPVAVSPAGALGLMQLMPALATELGVDEPFDPRQNIMAGTRYLRKLLDLHRGNIKLALASYNAGPGAVARYGRIPPFGETRRYVMKVTKLLRQDRG
jgi:soluble lytic murein transglycosylase-like protein